MNLGEIDKQLQHLTKHVGDASFHWTEYCTGDFIMSIRNAKKNIEEILKIYEGVEK